jgi:pancreatic triacylglycerol lipase
MLKVTELVFLFVCLLAGSESVQVSNTRGPELDPDPYINGSLVYIPDRNGNFYWYDINESPPDVLKDKIVKYFLYTRRNKVEGQRIYINKKENVTNSYFNPDRPTRFLIHGFMNGGRSYFSQKAKDAYLVKGEYNVIVVDWGSVAKTINYYQAK